MSELKPLYSVEETLRIQTTKLNQQLNKLLEQNTQIIELTVERDNALAQNAELIAYAADAERWFNKHDPNGYISPKREIVKQHLRDRDAEKGRAGFVAGYMLCNGGSPLIAHNYQGFADKYAESIKAGNHEKV